MLLSNKKTTTLMELAIFISQNSNTDVFVSYYPHVDGLDVRVYPDGWNVSDKETIIKYSIRNDKLVSNLTACDHLKDDYHYIDDCITDLEKIADNIPGFYKKK